MAENTKISWAHHTFNPWIGCTRVSPGCRFCYAEVFAGRYLKIGWGDKYKRHRTAESTWAKVKHWNRMAEKNGVRYRVFCASLADVMEDRPELSEIRTDLWNLILECPYLDFLLLTKRPQNYGRFFPLDWYEFGCFPKNIWLGTTICNQAEYDSNWHLLKRAGAQLDARVTFISYEPLLGPIKMHQGTADWNLIGGESGFLKDARIMDLHWVQGIISQIRIWNHQNPQEYAKKIWFKQMGVHVAKKLKMKDSKGENGILELPAEYDWLKVREIPFVAYGPDDKTDGALKLFN